MLEHVNEVLRQPDNAPCGEGKGEGDAVTSAEAIEREQGNANNEKIDGGKRAAERCQAIVPRCFEDEESDCNDCNKNKRISHIDIRANVFSAQIRELTIDCDALEREVARFCNEGGAHCEGLERCRAPADGTEDKKDN